MGMEYRPYYLAREWTKAGHKVTIVAGDYSHLRQHNPQVDRKFKIEMIDGIRYLWIRTGEYDGNGVARALTMFRFCGMLEKLSGTIVKEVRPDVVISSSTYPLDSYPAKRIAKAAGAKYIHEVHDMWPSTLYEIGGMSRNHPFVRMLQVAENHAYKSCDELVSLLSEAKGYMCEHGLAPEKFHCIRNGIVLDEWQDPEDLPAGHYEVFRGLRDEGKSIILYFGGHALSNDIDKILEVASEMRGDKEAAFVLVGDGAEKPRLMREAKDKGLDNVYFLPPVSKLAVPNLLGEADCVIITAKDSPLYRFGVSFNKMADAMMGGKLIISSVNAPSTVIGESGCGFEIKSGKATEIADAVRKTMEMPGAEASRIGRRGKEEVLAKYTYDKIAAEFEKLFF